MWGLAWSTTNWHLLLGVATSIRTISCAVTAADFQHPSRGAQGGEHLRKPDGRSSDRSFQELNLWTQFSNLLIPRKALKSFMVMIASHDQQKPSAKKCALDCMYFPFTKITCVLTFPPTSWE